MHDPGRVLVTGAAGRIGSTCVATLSGAGYPVTALDLVAPADTAADRVFTGDITDRFLVRSAMAGVTTVVHLAAYITPWAAETVEVFTTNTIGTFTVLAEAVAAGATRAVIASSINASGVHMNPHRGFPDYYPIDEAMPFDFADPYSLSKATDENSLRMWHRSAGIDGIAFRFPFTFSADQIAEARREAAADPMRNAGEGWSYLDLRDAGDLVLTAATADWTGVHVLSVASQRSLLDRDTEDALRQFVPDVPVRRPIEGRRPGVDTSRLEALLGWRATH